MIKKFFYNKTLTWLSWSTCSKKKETWERDTSRGNAIANVHLNAGGDKWDCVAWLVMLWSCALVGLWRNWSSTRSCDFCSLWVALFVVFDTSPELWSYHLLAHVNRRHTTLYDCCVDQQRKPIKRTDTFLQLAWKYLSKRFSDIHLHTR